MRALAVVLTATLPALAQTAPLGDPAALDFAPIDALTLGLEGGGSTASEPAPTSVDWGARLELARAELAGFRARVLDLGFLHRPALHGGALSGTLVSVDAWMLGTGRNDSSLCPFWFGAACDDHTGFVGLGGSLLGAQHDTASARTVLRLGELDLVGSPGPAFSGSWSRRRVLPHAGLSVDRVWRAPGLPDRWLPRLVAGVQGTLRVARVSVEPAFDWRPRLGALTDDAGFEARLDLLWRTQWYGGLDHAGDALRVGLRAGYAFWNVPGHSYGSDWLGPARHVFFVRVAVLPSFFSAVHP
jgi:hypothetical protein